MSKATRQQRLGLFHRLLLSLSPERAHRIGVAAVRVAQANPLGRRQLGRQAPRPSARLRQSLMGLDFPNPVGLAAGFDKDAEIVRGMAAFGFGWLEVGTVTPRPQPGNRPPRLFRYPSERSLENRMGFNNAGSRALLTRLQDAYPAAVPLGINLGKNKDTPNERALADYLGMLEMFTDVCDYFVVNVSSPNTPGLRDLQDSGFLAELMSAAVALADKPIFLKLSPDLEARRAVELVSATVDRGAAGVILTNTTSDYSLLPSARGVGGLSGEILREKSFALFDAVASEVYGACTLVSVGGIDSGAEVYRRLRAGAALVQLYTALVYRGPRLLAAIADELETLLDRGGYESVSQIVGLDRGGCG